MHNQYSPLFNVNLKYMYIHGQISSSNYQPIFNFGLNFPIYNGECFPPKHKMTISPATSTHLIVGGDMPILYVGAAYTDPRRLTEPKRDTTNFKILKMRFCC